MESVNMAPLTLLLLATLLANVVAVVVGACTVDDLQVSNVTGTTMLVNWDSRGCKRGGFRVTATHAQRLACPDSNPTNTAAKKVIENLPGGQAYVVGLEPYSSYGITVQGQDTNGSLGIQAITTADTKPTAPAVKMIGKPVSAHVQAIHFSWELADSSCRLRNGQPDGFYVELRGLDEWARSTFENATVAENAPYYYAQRLASFTTYSLTVYAVNRGMTPAVPLVMRARTKPGRPRPPVDSKATPTSPTSIHARWAPHYPPNGIVTGYVLSYGIVAGDNGSVSWQKRVEVSDERNYCSKMSRSTDFTCFVLHDLMPNTTYALRLQARNEGVEATSAFGDMFNATTDPMAPNSPITESAGSASLPMSSVVDEEPALRSVDRGLVIIVIGLVVIMMLAVVVATLVYKIKKLALITRNHTACQQPPANMGHATSFMSVAGRPAVGSVYMAESVATNVTNLHAYVEPARSRIQGRRLPDPPTLLLTGPLSRLKGIDDSEYVNPDTWRPPDVVSSHHTAETCMDSTDINGYLRPTFPDASMFTAMVRNTGHADAVIPTQSYVSNDVLRSESPHELSTSTPPTTAQGTTMTMTNESRPLIQV